MQRDSNRPTICKIEKVVEETPTVRTLVFTDQVLANECSIKLIVSHMDKNMICMDIEEAYTESTPDNGKIN